MHSATKYFGGHSDVMGGTLMFAKKNEFSEKCHQTRSMMGGVLSPFNCVVDHARAPHASLSDAHPL